jgi:hypothetical protein
MDLGTMTRTALFTGLLAASLAACGSDGDDDKNGFTDQNVDKIKEQVLSDMRDAKSMTMSGHITSDGTETTLELSSDTDGNCTGSVSMGEGTADFLRTSDDATFLKADEAFWRSTAGDNADAVLSVVGSKWAKLPAGDNQFAEFCDLDNFLDELEDDEGEDDKATKLGETEVDGEKALEISFDDDGDVTHVWVATEGKHYILKLSNEGDEPGEFTFSDYDERVDAQAPADTEYVDLSQAGS